MGVHESHCCKIHGCKYGEADCPVTTGRTRQLYLCEDCKLEGIEAIPKNYVTNKTYLLSFENDDNDLSFVSIPNNEKETIIVGINEYYGENFVKTMCKGGTIQYDKGDDYCIMDIVINNQQVIVTIEEITEIK